MAWPTDSSGVSTSNVDSATRNPADARADIYNAFINLQNVIDGRGQASGVASLDSNSQVPQAQINPTLSSSGSTDITLSPATSMVKIQDFVNLNPVAYASLPSSPAQGDVAFLTTDGAAASQNQLVLYNGSAWKYVADPSGSDVAAS